MYLKVTLSQLEGFQRQGVRNHKLLNNFRYQDKAKKMRLSLPQMLESRCITSQDRCLSSIFDNPVAKVEASD